MSANNYYGFTHAGTQYGYVNRAFRSPTDQCRPAVGRMTRTSYTPVAPVAQSTAYSLTSQMYSTARPAYDQSYQQAAQTGANLASTYSYMARPQVSSGSMSYPNDSGQYAQAISYPYTGAVSTYTNSYSSVVTNYAATALYNQQASATEDSAGASVMYSNNKPVNWNFKKNLKGNKPKIPTKVQQLHYCEVCKISCAGPQTYKEHLEGQRHKKKEAQSKSGGQPNAGKRPHGSVSGLSLHCELCDVTCTGNDAYAAHIRGAKHQKVLKLHTKLGKPIPPNQPVVMSSAKSNQNKPTQGTGQLPNVSGKIKVLGTPRINFVGGGRLHTTPQGDLKEENFSDTSTDAAQMFETQEIQAESSEQTTQILDLEKSDAQPVGQDYIEEVKGDDGKVVTFHCKLCDCKFNDPNAKEMHLKGRRHRLQYKKKVDPNLVVDIKPSLKHRKPDFKDRRFNYKRDNMYYWGNMNWYNNRYFDNRIPGGLMPPQPPHMMPPMFMGGGPMQPFRRPNTGSSWDDIHIMQKHSEICPKEEELDEIHHVVSCTERALKLVSDKLSEDDASSVDNQTEIGEENSATTNNSTATLDSQNESQQNGNQTDKLKIDASQNRVLKGLMRVGALAKGLLLSGDREVDLVVICAEKPTKMLLQRVADHLPQQLQEASSNESFEITLKPQEAGLSVCSMTEPKITVNVQFTSPLVRDENTSEVAHGEMVKEPKQLDRLRCLSALAALRHAKWFQARVANLQPCSIIIRLLRDLCKRLPTWSKLNLWAVELLCEKVISSAGDPLTPGEALRHTFETIASGLLLPGGAGLIDPCEKEPTDALASLTRQEREDITSSAQHALRLIAFRQIYKILGVDPIPQRNRKRRIETNTENLSEAEVKKEKKDEETYSDDNAMIQDSREQVTSENATLERTEKQQLQAQ